MGEREGEESLMEPTHVIERFAELLSAGNTPGALALYERDAAFVVEPGHVAIGHEAIGEALERFAASSGHKASPSSDLAGRSSA